MTLKPERKSAATILVYVYSNGFAGYAVAPRVEGDGRRHEVNLSGTTLPLHCTYEIAGDYIPLIPDRQMRIGELEQSIESLATQGFRVTKIPADAD